MSQVRWNTLADLPRRPRVWLVEDQPLIIQTVQQELGTDCQVLVAADGPALNALSAEKLPDLVLLDSDLPGLNGLHLMEQIKAAQPLQQIPVIFITARTDGIPETPGLDVAEADFVTKPINPSVLRWRVRTHLLLKFHADQLRGMIFRDGLTGVFSRYYFEEQIGVECARAKRNTSVLSLMMIDIDYFQAYNDYYGHQAGDDALRLIARVLESQLHRPGDLVARYGGEEFVCLLPATDFEPAMQLAGRIEQAVRARSIGHASSLTAPVVTVSIGLATRRRATDGGAEALLRLAGEQLTIAKQQGRARVCGKVVSRPRAG